MMGLMLPLLMIWIGVKTEMPIYWYIILGAIVLFDALTIGYKAGRGKDAEE